MFLCVKSKFHIASIDEADDITWEDTYYSAGTRRSGYESWLLVKFMTRFKISIDQNLFHVKIFSASKKICRSPCHYYRLLRQTFLMLCRVPPLVCAPKMVKVGSKIRVYQIYCSAVNHDLKGSRERGGTGRVLIVEEYFS
jgi:hypothetical protein